MPYPLTPPLPAPSSTGKAPVLTLSHARGLRRQADQYLAERLERNPPGQGPRRFGPHVRTENKRLQAAYGERARQIKNSKREAMWALVLLDSDDTYRLATRRLVRKDGVVEASLSRLPMVVTAHFVERVMQAGGHGVGSLLDVLIGCADVIYPVAPWNRSKANRAGCEWALCGEVAIALQGGLVWGSMPTSGDLILRTLVAEPCLEYRHLAQWRALCSAPVHVAVQPRPAKTRFTVSGQVNTRTLGERSGSLSYQDQKMTPIPVMSPRGEYVQHPAP